MKVILLDNIKGIGRLGDVKEVNDGYARNFLLPKKLAKSATTGAVADLVKLKGESLKSKVLDQQQAQELAAKLADTKITITGKANEKGRLFAGIEAKHIAQALAEQASYRIKPENVLLDEHIKTVGEHPVKIQLGQGIETSLIVVVTKLR